MSIQKIVCPDTVLQQEAARPVALEDAVYIARKALLDERIRTCGLDFAVLYGDREHFANIEYFTKYDCRFEEGLFVAAKDGTSWIVIGNEGMGYSDIVPFATNRVYYGNFSLQGQPRKTQDSLADIFRRMGMTGDSKVGLAGFKYYECGVDSELSKAFDVPSYIVESLKTVVNGNVTDFTRQLTGLPDGLRMTVRTPNEIAFIEYQCVTASNVMRRIMAGVKEGMTELEISANAKADLRPCMAFANILAGSRSVQLGLKSPDDFNRLSAGDPMTLSYSTRGCMCARSGVAAHGYEDLSDAQKEKFDRIYESYWQAIAAWYGTICVGVQGQKLYEAVAEHIGAPEFGMALNPGHSIGMDEWTNSPVSPTSQVRIHSGTHIQCDMIAGSADPVMNAICEDTVVIADEPLRAALAKEYPEVYARILARQAFMRQVLHIELNDDVLPMSGLNGIMFPFMLDTTKIFAL